MPSNQTTNYQLSQWVKSDQVKMEDFNADNAKIDGALASQAAALAGLTAAAPHWGDCQICTQTYTGTGLAGAANPTTLTFPYPPKLVAVVSPAGFFLVMVCGAPMSMIPVNSPPTREVHITWNGNSISWYGSTITGQMNENGETYHVVALCSKS